MAETGTRSISEEEAARYRAEFPIFDHTTYLNSCSLGPLSRRSTAALQRYMDAWSAYGAPAWWEEWLPQIELARARFAQLIGAGTHEVTVSHSISSALSSVASAFDYDTRQKVVCAELDFPTIPYQWLAKEREGVQVAFAGSADRISVPMSEYERLVDGDTALVATSHVFYTTGAMQPVRRLADLAHAYGAKLVIDGYHSVGVFPVDVKALDVDVYVGGVLKWLLGGPGLTFIYVREELLAELSPAVTGWFASSDQFAFDAQHLQLASDANRFQLGTPAMPTVYTGIAGMEMILEVDPELIAGRIRFLTARVVDHAKRAGFTLVSPEDPGERGGIVMLELPNPRQAVSDLAKRGFTVDYRPGLVRISPHFYNTSEDVDRLMETLVEIQGERG
jgi:selenocysteine lyase/cysteine desulfurase